MITKVRIVKSIGLGYSVDNYTISCDIEQLTHDLPEETKLAYSDIGDFVDVKTLQFYVTQKGELRARETDNGKIWKFSEISPGWEPIVNASIPPVRL